MDFKSACLKKEAILHFTLALYFLTIVHCSHKSVRMQPSLCLVRVGVQCMHCVVADTVVTPALTSGD